MDAAMDLAQRARAAERAANDDPVARLNRDHAIVVMEGTVAVLRESRNDRGGRSINFLSPAGIRTLFANQTVEVDAIDSKGRPKAKRVPIVDLWMASPERRTFEGVTFAPSCNAPESYYNLWTGFAVEPLDVDLFRAAMRCRRLLAHLKHNVCNGNREHFRYLLAWTADMMQDPDHKKGVAVVLRGEKGTGKSTFADILRRLLGGHAIKVSHMKHLTGNFNGHLADKLLVVAEESFWAGDKNDEGPLKDMITSDTLTVERKGVDAVEMRSVSRIVMVTNAAWAVPATRDERRYFVLDVGSKRRQDHAYFSAIHKQMDGDGLQAFLGLLLQIPLAGFDLRAVPETDALKKQRALSLEPHFQFIADCLHSGAIAGTEWTWGATVVKQNAYDAYLDYARKRGKSHLLTANGFAKHFAAATDARSVRPRSTDARSRSWLLPSVRDSLAAFEGLHKVSMGIVEEWGDEPF
ncbi:primase-helicase family protein [Lysobacter sp. 2RAF19]